MTLRVAVTGHRPNRLHIGTGEVRRQIGWVLGALREGSRGQSRVAVSALAEGADRIFAEVALASGFRLEVLLPFSSADYETTFGDAATTADYRALLSRAQSVTELRGDLSNTKGAYEAVGRASVAGAGILVAVWDGAPAAGRGGTPEIVDHALACDVPVIWIDAARIRLPRLIIRPTAHGPRDIPLDRLAARAKPLTKRRVAGLARDVERRG